MVEPQRISQHLSHRPSCEEVTRARVFSEPLIAIGAEPSFDENAALSAALIAYSQRSGPDDFSSLTDYLERYPYSPWNASLLTNLGTEYYNTGHFSKTINVWKQAWQLAKTATDPKGKAVADRAVSELAQMYARLGRVPELESLLKAIEGRSFMGGATENIVGAKEGLINMKTRPEISFRCGPLALLSIERLIHPEMPCSDAVFKLESTQNGCSLTQVADLSGKMSLDYQMVYRESETKFVVPSVVHLKVGHYTALVKQVGDRYLLKDPTFGSDIWVTEKTLDEESSGFFLIPSKELTPDWRLVDREEGETIWGKGNTRDRDRDRNTCDDPASGGDKCKDSEPKCKGLAVPRVHLMLVSLNINDEPVGYTPPVGPAVNITVRYNQREARQPAIFQYSNFGSKWTFDWLSYIKENPQNPANEVQYYVMGGGTRAFTGFDPSTKSYAFQQYDQTKLTRTSSDRYEMLSPDGTLKIFAQSNGAIGTERKMFLTEYKDPAGNSVFIHYDENLRIDIITDAVNQKTVIAYENPNDIHKITKITDPFGRSASFEYDTLGRLIKITDVIGLTSEFTYDEGDFITALSTPYGVTRFSKVDPDFDADPPKVFRALEIIYPDGERERVEYTHERRQNDPPQNEPPQPVPQGMSTTNAFLEFRNTYYWDRQASAYSLGDQAKARLYHWLHMPDRTKTAGILESVKEPLENRVWYDYDGQINQPLSIEVGSTNKPRHIGRVLDDGSTQLYTYEYNGFGNVTKTIDPVGRTFSYLYADNGIDLLEVRQTRAGQNELLSKTTYNAQHLPLTRTDAAGQTTTYTYNSRGQALTETNALGETTTYKYDEKGFRTSVVGPLGDTITIKYDALGRVQSRTDESGYTLVFEYDALDRLIKSTYPDGTFDQFTYTRLDRTLIRDRAGRETAFEYNSVRQMIKRTDPLGRVTFYQWCKCGDLKMLIDPMGRSTTWHHDIQGRVNSKEYADGSKITYLYESATSRLRQRIDEKLQVTQYHYYRDDTLRGKTYSNATVSTPSVTFTYDRHYNRVTSITDGTGTSLYFYLPITPMPTLGAGQLGSIDVPLPAAKIAFTYDALGRRIARSIDGVSASYDFDDGGRLIKETNALGTFDYTYDGASSRLTKLAYPNGQVTTYGYFDNSKDRRLERITHTHGTAPISEFIYDCDTTRDRITTWSQQSGTEPPVIFSYGYDAVNQLTSAVATQNGNTVNTYAYTYDPAGNRLTEQINDVTTQASYNALNQLITINTESEVDAHYGWDAEHRLTFINSDKQEAKFTYDGLGRRVGIRHLVDSTEIANRLFLWVEDKICEERSSVDAVSKQLFNHGIAINRGANSEILYYAADHLGSIRELINNSGDIKGRFTYDPFGHQTPIIDNVDSHFSYTRMLNLREFKIYLTLFRAYDAKAGRWLIRELLPFAEWSLRFNLYVYVNNNPVNLVDLDGFEPQGSPGASATPDPARHIRCLAVGGAAFILCRIVLKGPPELCKQLADLAFEKCKRDPPPEPNWCLDINPRGGGTGGGGAGGDY